jgi:biotin carboxyl carrier protein
MKLRTTNRTESKYTPPPSKNYKKSQLWKVARFSVVIGVLLFIATFSYYKTYIQIDGVVIVDSNKITLESPGKAIVEKMIRIGEFEDVVEGEEIARLGLHVSDLLGMDQQIYRLKEKLLTVEEQVEELRADHVREGIRFEQSLRKLKLEIETANLEIINLNAQEKNEQKFFDLNDTESKNASKLYELEVINIRQLKKVQKDSLVAESNLEQVQRRISFYKSLVEHLNKRIELLKEDKVQFSQENEKAIVTQSKKQEFIKAELAELTRYSKGKNRDMEIYSPINGRVLQNHIRQGDSLVEGSPIITLYRPDFLELRVYVEERYMDRITKDSIAVVKIFDKKFEANIKRINKVITHSPRELRGRKLVPEDRYYFTIDLDRSNIPDGLFPGKTGRVIFKQ